MRRLADGIMRGLAQLLIRIFFRRVEVAHADRLPDEGPVIVVANHTNGLVDGLLLMVALRRYPRFLGKSTLFKIPPLWPFLKLAGVIPVYRAIDGARTGKNRSAFATSNRLLARRGVVALFPEGISHDEASVQPLRTGAARIALEAASDGITVSVVAAGLLYDAKATFRSRALVRLGEPAVVGPDQVGDDPKGHLEVRALTESLGRQLAVVSPPYASWVQADELTHIAEIVARGSGGELPHDVTLLSRSDVAERLAVLDARPDLRADFVELRRISETYNRDLTIVGLADAQVAASYAAGTIRRSLVWSAVRVVVAIPFALVGAVIHVVPYQIMKQIAKMPTNEGVKATVKLLGCFILFVITYVTLGVVVSQNSGPWLGVIAAFGAPLCGYVAVRLFERVKRVGGLLGGYRAMRGRGSVRESISTDRQAVVDAANRILSAA